MRYFRQNRELRNAIEAARADISSLQDVFDLLLKSRIWFCVRGALEDRGSYEYLEHEDGSTLLAAYTSRWHARKSKMQGREGMVEVDFAAVFEIADEGMGVMLDPNSSKNMKLSAAAVRDLRMLHETRS